MQYYEGILQLRNVIKEIIDKVRKSAAQQNITIAKEKKYPYGIDIYLASWRFTISIARKLQRAHGGELKISRKLYGIDKAAGKKVYRVTVLYRMPKIRKCQIITFKGKQFKVISVGKDIILKDIKSGRKIRVKHSDLA